MLSAKEYQERLDRIQALRERLAQQLSGSLVSNPALAEELNGQLDELVQAAIQADESRPGPPDGGLAALVGIGPEAAKTFGETLTTQGVAPYDEQVNSERIVAVGDLYYLYQHEQIGVFKVVRKLKQLFEAGAVRLSAGPGAYGLYQFDRRDVLRYTRKDRHDAYRRVLGYGRGLGAGQSRPNTDFHMLFAHFVNQVTLFWRDKRISDVIRERALDPSFGSIAVVRRRQRVGCGGRGPDPLLRRAAPELAAAADGRDRPRRAPLVGGTSHPRDRAGRVRGGADEHRGARGGVADLSSGDEPGAPYRLRPGTSVGAAGAVRHRRSGGRAQPADGSADAAPAAATAQAGVSAPKRPRHLSRREERQPLLDAAAEVAHDVGAAAGGPGSRPARDAFGSARARRVAAGSVGERRPPPP